MYAPFLLAILMVNGYYQTQPVGTLLYASAAYQDDKVTPNNVIEVFDLTTDNRVTAITVCEDPRGLVSDGTNLWVGCYGVSTGSPTNTTNKIAPDGTVTAITGLGLKPAILDYDQHGSMWFANLGSDYVSVVDATTNAVSSVSIDTGDATSGVAYASSPDSLFFTSQSNTYLYKINRATKSMSHCGTPGVPTYGVTYGGGYIWASESGGSNIYKIDPATCSTTTYGGLNTPTRRPAWDAKNSQLWIPEGTSNTVQVIDTSGTIVHTYTGLINAVEVSFDNNYAYITATSAGNNLGIQRIAH